MPRRAFLLFSGSNDRAVFALARAFAQCDAPFAVVAWKRSDRILRGRYRRNVCSTREHDALTLESLREWVAAARRMLPEARLVLVPSSEFLNTFLLTIEPAILEELDCELPLVDAGSYAELTNKASSTAWFASRGISVPRELPSWLDALPLVAKPRQNVGEDGLVRYPVLLQSERDRDAFLARADLDAYFPQEFVRGTSHYLLAYLARDGRAFTSSQINLGQQAHGKSIVLARTACFHRESVAELAVDALRSYGFHGFVMLEFIVGASGPRFIELNPRPWGPLQLCVDHQCGIVEAFVGDRLHGDPLRHEDVRRRKPASARYLWFGGILKDLRADRRVKWEGGSFRGWLNVLRHFPREVYLRRDSWKVFLREMAGR